MCARARERVSEGERERQKEKLKGVPLIDSALPHSYSTLQSSAPLIVTAADSSHGQSSHRNRAVGAVDRLATPPERASQGGEEGVQVEGSGDRRWWQGSSG